MRHGRASVLIALLTIGLVLSGCGAGSSQAPTSAVPSSPTSAAPGTTDSPAASPQLIDLGVLQGVTPTHNSGTGPRLALPPGPLAVPGQPFPLGAVVQFAFPIANDGTEPLTVSAIQANCECIRATIQSAPIAPGQSALVHIEFETVVDGPGADWETLTFVTNDPGYGATRPPLQADLRFAMSVIRAP